MRLFIFIVSIIFNFPLYGDWSVKTLERLSLDEKIGQLFMIAVNADENGPANKKFIENQPYTLTRKHAQDCIQHYHVGGIIYLGLSPADNLSTCSTDFQKLSKLPLLVGIDAECGLSMRGPDGMRFPQAMTLGALQDRLLIYRCAYEIGTQLKDVGIHINFAPVLDVNTNPVNPVIHYRSFGDHQDCVAQCGLLYMQGLCDAGVIACAKHFPGHGDTATDSHSALPHLDHSHRRLHQIELYPFKKLIENQVPAIMLGHLAVPAFDKTLTPASLSWPMSTYLLEHELKFNGLKITDGLGMKALTDSYASGEIEVKALSAGADILLCPVDVAQAVDSIKLALYNGTLSHELLDQKVLKVLRIKELYCFDKKPYCKNTPTERALALKKQLYQEAITIAWGEPSLEKIEKIFSKKLINYVSTRNTMTHFQALLDHDMQCKKIDLENNPSSAPDNKPTVITLFDLNNNARQNYNIPGPMLDFINMCLHQNRNLYVIVFGTPYCLALLKNVPTVIVAYEDDLDAQEAAFLVITGKLKAQGKLPITLAS